MEVISSRGLPALLNATLFAARYFPGTMRLTFS
jgi:hypothetical protein